MNSLPPLNALRVFEAAARLLSLKHAADELCVTPGAVSQMLKVLEDHLGTRLFHRAGRGVALTDAGQTLLPPLRNAFRQIAEAVGRVEAKAETGVLTVSATPFFASAWLVPRLRAFQAACPEIDLRIVTGTGLADFARDGVDVAIRHGLGRYPGLASTHLLAVDIVPVAAPDLVRRLGKPKRAAQLADWPQLHDSERKAWPTWLAARGIAEIATPRGPSFDDSALLHQAALAGQGAALLPSALVAADFADGRLVRLAADTRVESIAYYLVCPETMRESPKVSAFRDWLREEIAAGAKQSLKAARTPPRAATASRSSSPSPAGPRPTSRPRRAPDRGRAGR